MSSHSLVKCGGGSGETCPAMIPLSALFPRYDEEVSLRATAENEFVALKKVSNMGSGSRAMKDLRMTGSHCGEQWSHPLWGAVTLPIQDGKFP